MNLWEKGGKAVEVIAELSEKGLTISESIEVLTIAQSILKTEAPKAPRKRRTTNKTT